MAIAKGSSWNNENLMEIFGESISKQFLIVLIILLQSIIMSQANNNPVSSLTGAPRLALVLPGTCQFDEDFVAVPLISRVAVSSTSSILRFGLPDTSKPLNLSTCACILAKANVQIINNDDDEKKEDDKVEAVIRPYTPISTNAQVGYFDLLVKNYGPTGKMSRHLHEIQNGDMVEFKHIPFNVKIQAPFDYKKIIMLVGGTGITPMIQALHAILGNDNSSTKVTMLYGSKVQDDILGREMIDKWANDYHDRFSAIHILSHEPKDSNWTGLRGHINKEILLQHIPKSSSEDNDYIVFVCGPPPMYDALCGPRDEKDKVKGILGELGCKPEQVYKF